MQIRIKNFNRLHSFFKRYERFFILPVQDRRVKTTWISFPLTIRPGAPFSRMDITKYLEEHNVQTRPIFTGNVLRQPAFKSLAKNTSADLFVVADNIMKNGFVVGCHHGMTKEHITRLESIVRSFLSLHGIT